MTALPAWDALLSRAIVGLDNSAPEARTQVAAASLRKLAGARAVSRPPLSPSPPDPRPEVSARAASHLRQVMADGPTILLKEWLEAATAAHKHVPFDYLPALLALAAKEAYLRPAIVDAVGPRGLWLASRNPAWRIPTTPENSVWETGSIADRAAWLRHRRGVDPAGARDMLAATIGGDTAYNRRKLIEAMEVGLSEADEAFLESMLNDRSREVREAVVDLLADLPNSALVARMTERADRCVNFEGSGNQRKLIMQLPEPDAGSLRDGVDPRDLPGVWAHGPKAALLVRSLSCVPPTHWETRFATTPREFIEACKMLDKPGHVLDGITRGAVRYRNVSWLRALLLHSRPHSHTSLQHDLLLRAVPESERAGLLAEVFLARPEMFTLRGSDEIVSQPQAFLVCFSRPWPDKAAADLVRLLSQMAARGVEGYSGEVIRAPRFVPRALIPQAIAALPQGDDRPALVTRVEQLLTLRKEMLDAIEEDG